MINFTIFQEINTMNDPAKNSLPIVTGLMTSIFTYIKDNPGISGPVLAAAVGATAHGFFSLWGDSKRHGWDEKHREQKAQLKEADNLFAQGLNHMKERRYYEAEKSFNQAQEYFTAYCGQDGKSIYRENIKERQINILANRSKALFMQRKFTSEQKKSPSALAMIEEWMTLNNEDRDAFNLRGIYLPEAILF